MTLADAGEIFAYWEREPPVHLIVQAIARLLGWTAPNQRSRPVPIDEIAASAPPGLAVTHGGKIDMPKAVFDLETLRVRNRARAGAIGNPTARPAEPLSRTPGSA